MSTSRKPLLCLDFDGVLHSYTSGWQGADVVSDPPVPGAMEALADYTERFRVAIHSSRSGQPGGIEAMRNWLYRHLMEWDAHLMQAVMGRIEWPTSKPATFVTIDDRALTFTGTWPEPQDLAAFQPWNKREAKRGFAFLGGTEIGAVDHTGWEDWFVVEATTKGWAIVDDNPMQLVADVRRVGYGPTLYRAMTEAVRMSVTAASALIRRGPWLFEEPQEYVSPFEPAPLAKKETLHG